MRLLNISFPDGIILEFIEWKFLNLFQNIGYSEAHVHILQFRQDSKYSISKITLFQH